MNPNCLKLMLVTQKRDTPTEKYLSLVATCAQAGITCVQLREKNTRFADNVAFGQQLQQVLAPFSIPLIINDDLELAKALNADGIHLGQTDGCPIDARNILGKDKIIGVSIDSLEELIQANDLPIDYVGVGAIFPTINKKNVSTIWGVDGLQNLSGLSKLPIVAIGGINELNAKLVMQSGASGIAVIGAIHDSAFPQQTVSHLRNTIDNNLGTFDD